jgi:hypothetical protein
MAREGGMVAAIFNAIRLLVVGVSRGRPSERGSHPSGRRPINPPNLPLDVRDPLGLCFAGLWRVDSVAPDRPHRPAPSDRPRGIRASFRLRGLPQNSGNSVESGKSAGRECIAGGPTDARDRQMAGELRDVNGSGSAGGSSPLHKPCYRTMCLDRRSSLSVWTILQSITGCLANRIGRSGTRLQGLAPFETFFWCHHCAV